MSTLFTRENLLRSLLAVGCFATVIFFFSPSWGAFQLWARVPEMSGMLEVRRGASVLTQVAHPGVEIADPLHRVIQWRLLFPFIGHLLNLPAPVLFSLAHIGCIVVLGYVVSLLRRHGAGWLTAALATVTLGAGSWLFVSTGWLGYFDSWLALGLLILAFARSSWSVCLACLWAPWVDERFVLAAPLALFCRWLYVDTLEAASASSQPASVRTRFNARSEFGIPAALLVVFLIVRLGLLSGSSAANATIVGYFSGKNYLDAPLGRIVLGIWEGLRASWLFVIAAVLLLRHWPRRSAALGIAIVLMVAAGLATAQDYSRSMTMLLPVAVLGALLMIRRGRPPEVPPSSDWQADRSERPPARDAELPSAKVAIRTRAWLGGAVAIALLLPAHHVMNDAVNPIFYLYHELAALESPPPTAMPELRELHAMHLLEQGRYAEAERELTLAIKLSDNPASPAKQRGRLYASAQRWDDAKRDFTLVVQNDPGSPDGWYLRSEVELAMNENDAARADYDHARSVGGVDWAERPDVKRYATILNQRAPQP